MIKKIDLVIPTFSQYYALHHFTYKLYEALSRKGIDCRLLTVPQISDAFHQSPPDFTIHFNSGVFLRDSEQMAQDFLGAPTLCILVDPPFHYTNIFSSKYSIVACDDRQNVKLFEKYTPLPAFFLPHAAERDIQVGLEAERHFDVVFLGTLEDPDAIKASWHENFGPIVANLMEQAALITLSDPYSHFISVFLNSLLDAHEISKIDFSSDLVCDALASLERFIKAKERLLILQSIRTSQVDVFGEIESEPLKKKLQGQSNLKLHPQVNYPKALDIMKHSKIILNSSSKNKEGAHERIFTALLCGALVMTGDNVYLREEFSDGKDLCLLQIWRPETIDEKVRYFLDHPEERISMAARGREKTLASHTWDANADIILATMPHLLQKLPLP